MVTAAVPQDPQDAQTDAQSAPVQSPPLTGLDQPTREPGFASRSFLLLGAHGGESLHYDPNAGADDRYSAARGLMSAEMEKAWKHLQTKLSYAGGESFDTGSSKNSQVQDFGTDVRLIGSKTQMLVRDRLSYLPEGNFEYSVFGGEGAYQVSGLSGLFGPSEGGSLFDANQFGSFGNEPRLNNLSAVQLEELVSPRSAVTGTAAFLINHFTDQRQGLIDSQEMIAEGGYSYQLNRKDKIGFVYAYQSFHYPIEGFGGLKANVLRAIYSHRVTGRIDLIAGAGPQFVSFAGPFGQVSQINLNARTSIRYQLPRTSLTASYAHLVSGGSGFYAGANSDIVKFSVHRVVSRSWDLLDDTGFSRHSRILPVSSVITSPTYDVVYTGVALRRQFGRYFDSFGAYQFNNLVTTSCSGSSLCRQFALSNVFTVGMDFYFRPIRLD